MLFKQLLPDIVQYLTKKTELETPQLQIAFLANYIDSILIKQITTLAQASKHITIVTNYPEKFKKLIEDIYQNDGIIIRASRNRKKALQKSHIIINYDFPPELLANFTLPNKAILLNIEHKILQLPKSFNGININNYSIKYDTNILNYYSDEFDLKTLYEAHLLSSSGISDNIYINYLIGLNGPINAEEYKIFTK